MSEPIMVVFGTLVLVAMLFVRARASAGSHGKRWSILKDDPPPPPRARVLGLVVDEGITDLSVLDEDMMRQHGWLRAEHPRSAHITAEPQTRTWADWLSLSRWDQAPTHTDVSLTSRPVFGGLAEHHGITSLCLLYPPTESDPSYHVRPFFWTTEKAAVKAERAAAPAYHWCKDGLLNVVTHEHPAMEILQDATSLCRDMRVSTVGLDAWKSGDVDDLQHLGMRVHPVRHAAVTITPAMETLVNLCDRGLLEHGGHPILRLGIEKLALRGHSHSNSPDLIHSKTWAVGALAMIYAMATTMAHQSQESRR